MSCLWYSVTETYVADPLLMEFTPFTNIQTWEKISTQGKCLGVETIGQKAWIFLILQISPVCRPMRLWQILWQQAVHVNMPVFPHLRRNWVLPGFQLLSSLLCENGTCSDMYRFLILSETEHQKYFRWAWILHFLWIARVLIKEVFCFLLIHCSSS